jgi:hypothetical protein
MNPGRIIMAKPVRIFFRFVAISALVVNFFSYIHTTQLVVNNDVTDLTFSIPSVLASPSSSCGNNDEGGITSKKSQTIIAYATTITDCKSSEQDRLIERAAVLHMSIKLATQKSTKYRYHIYAFVHPDAVQCVSSLQKLGYRIKIHETPFNKSAIPNENLIIAQGNGCCGEKVGTKPTKHYSIHPFFFSDYI